MKEMGIQKNYLKIFIDIITAFSYEFVMTVLAGIIVLVIFYFVSRLLMSIS